MAERREAVLVVGARAMHKERLREVAIYSRADIPGAEMGLVCRSDAQPWSKIGKLGS